MTKYFPSLHVHTWELVEKKGKYYIYKCIIGKCEDLWYVPFNEEEEDAREDIKELEQTTQ